MCGVSVLFVCVLCECVCVLFIDTQHVDTARILCFVCCMLWAVWLCAVCMREHCLYPCVWDALCSRCMNRTNA